MSPPVDPFRVPTYVRLVNIGNDQVASPENNPAWWDFEDPLPAALFALAEALEDGAMYDVGANTGFYSVLLGKTRPDLPLRSFEPVPHIADLCRTNLEVNLLAPVVEQVALSDRIGTAPMFWPVAKHGQVETSATLNPWFRTQTRQGEEVPTTTVDAFTEESGDRVALMKIDVEGYEHVVLRGATAAVARDRPLLAVEVLPTSALDELERFVADTEYDVLTMRPGLDVRRETEVRFVPEGWNQLFVPVERVDGVLSVLEAARARFDAARQDVVSAWADVVTAEDHLHLHAVAEARRQVLESQRLLEVLEASRPAWRRWLGRG